MSTAASLGAARPGNWAARRRRRSWVVLAIAVLLLVLAVLLVLSGRLVRLDNSRNGRAILSPSVSPAQPAAGEVTLEDAGLLPIQVFLEPRTAGGAHLPAGLEAEVRRLDDGALLYSGPLTERMGPLEVLQPGQSSRLRLTISAVDTQGTGATALPSAYYWSASPELPWWWWIPVVLLCALLAAWVNQPRPEREGGR